MTANTDNHYYVPKPSLWPIVACIALFTLMLGLIHWLHGYLWGPKLILAGFIILVFMMFGWLGLVIRESRQNIFSNQVGRTFHIAMAWFIFSEVCFFGAFFGTLFYLRLVVVPELGGMGYEPFTHLLLWPDFVGQWPVFSSPNDNLYQPIKEGMSAGGLSLLGTIVLVTSSITVTFGHRCLLKNQRKALGFWMIITIILGLCFLGLQAHEYWAAYMLQDMRLNSGVYGNTFFMMTGFHGLHVTIGTIFLIVVTVRIFKGHFSESNHFAFTASNWYWHFVDVVWLLLFVLVYWW